ncbi:MAG: NAD(P)H-dependent oxidoreductase [Deltaproteobacteria bacterium]|nr:NAD(P)H-dependent oxidoreductase [Deltaproteobacteria bacterium]
MKLEVFICSTRPGRVGLPVGAWFEEQARAHGKFEVARVDLAEVNLPMMDEPKHPRLQQYEHAHTKAWSETVKSADAFVFVTPEYNYGMPAPLLNALDYLLHEWAYKPAAFVSYGGVSAGTRSVQMAKQVLTTLKIMPIPEAVSVPFGPKYVVDGVFKPPPEQEKAATVMLDELWKWTGALKTLRPG